MRKCASYTCVLFALGVLSVHGADGDGGYAGAFFQVPVGGRPTAMGGAYLAVSNDGAAPLYNPAGLATLRRPLFATSYRVMQLDRSLGHVTVMFPVRGQATLGAHWLYAGSGSVEARDSDGYPLGRDISMTNHQFSVVFAKRFERFIALGANISYLLSTMPEIDVNTVGFDFGLMVYVDQLLDRDTRDLMPVQDIRFAVTVKHLSKVYKWNSEQYNLRFTTSSFGNLQDDKVPVEVGLGASARFFQRKLLVATDLLKNQKQDPVFRAGAEFYFMPEFALRGGFSDGRFTTGTGYLFQIGKQQLAIDYAFSSDKADEGTEHIFSFDLLF